MWLMFASSHSKSVGSLMYTLYPQRGHSDCDGVAGGIKYSHTTSGLAISNNWVHDNIGPGIWIDGSASNWTIESNRT